MSYKNAKGNSPATGMLKSPPTRVVPTAPDAVTNIRKPILPGGLGQNGYEGASSSELSEVPISGLASNLKASGDDGTLDAVIKSGASGEDDWQTRKLDGKNVPTHPSMAAPAGSPSGKVAPTTSYQDGEPVRKPNA